MYFKKLRKRIIHFYWIIVLMVFSPICEDAVSLVSEMAEDLKAANISTIAMVLESTILWGLNMLIY